MNNYYPQYVIDGCNNKAIYHYDNLYRLLFSIFDFENLPSGWDNGYIKMTILNYGFIGAFKNTIIGKAAVLSGVETYNYMYRPSRLMYSNWILGNGSGTIGIDCEMIYCNYQLTPLSLLCRYYAELLANIDASLASNLYNTRISTVFYADNESERQTLYELYDKISEGNPAVLISKKYRDVLESRIIDINSAKNTFIGEELNQLYRNVKNRFLSDCGIPNSSYEKRERMTSAESVSANGEIYIMNNNLISSLENCVKKVNAILNTKIVVKNNIEEVQKIVSENILSNDNNGNAGTARLETV